jgi:hypothetical protein
VLRGTMAVLIRPGHRTAGFSGREAATDLSMMKKERSAKLAQSPVVSFRQSFDPATNTVSKHAIRHFLTPLGSTDL